MRLRILQLLVRIKEVFITGIKLHQELNQKLPCVVGDKSRYELAFFLFKKRASDEIPMYM